MDNVAFPLRRQGKKKPEAQALATDMLASVGLGDFLERRPAQLSGGQQQRVALARAMVKKSRILMLDEPLANLDYKLREQLREEFPRLVAANSDSVILYTTTEPREAMELGNTMIIMHNGSIVASGPPAELFAHPPTIDAASVISDPPISFISGFVRNNELFFAEGNRPPATAWCCRRTDLSPSRCDPMRSSRMVHCRPPSVCPNSAVRKPLSISISTLVER